MLDFSQKDTRRDSGGDGAADGSGAWSKQWYCYLGLRLRLQQGELMDFRAATAVFGDA